MEGFLIRHGLPAIPLVPVSSSQAIVGAVIGVGLLKGGRSIRWRVLGGISRGWIVTPIIAGKVYPNAVEFNRVLRERLDLTAEQRDFVLGAAVVDQTKAAPDDIEGVQP